MEQRVLLGITKGRFKYEASVSVFTSRHDVAVTTRVVDQHSEATHLIAAS